MKPKTIFECDETVFDTPGTVIWGPVQIGKTWTRLADTDDGGESGYPEASINFGDIMEEMGFSCPCDEC